ncbi:MULTISPECIES: ABC transporter permease [Kribbella]|uniref:Peptide/nickel transport system permease protein n=1 Tax=Kribbella pratensis TaxID=2512112 RepID=A0ABY2F7Q4_9ACTN|nr:MULTISPECIES: ABC transporter permease [Kribbella]TDW79428.1 peptide/nickel transport system permease protein [Kribbella sp. VKM Ac-2566]TDW84422.1 peptide/nickel transport system permease protein [Kribbella pratensis]
MLSVVARRGLYMLVTLAVVSVLSFAIIAAPPGSALSQKISQLQSQGGEVTEAQIVALKEQYGVDDSWFTQYGKWITGFWHGDFGFSFTLNEPVSSVIWSRLALSVLLSIGALLIAWGLSIPLGVYSATHRHTLPDSVITVIQFIGVAIPEFLFALVVMSLAAHYLGTDVGGLFSNDYADAPWGWGKFVDLLGHLWVPLIVIAAGSTAWLTRVMRANLLDVLNNQYVQTARAKGVAERQVIWKHAVRNSLHPLVMTFGTTFPVLISGEAIVSIVLNLPTIGPLLVNSLLNKDMYVAGTILLLLSALLVIGNFVADLLLTVVDPRIRFGE